MIEQSQVLYGIRHEYALTALDVLARRVRLAFLNHEAALSALDQVIALCAQELQWDTRRQALERREALAFLETMNRDGLKTPTVTKST
jgi:glycerol-3-phosphate dehydrogenase